MARRVRIIPTHAETADPHGELKPDEDLVHSLADLICVGTHGSDWLIAVDAAERILEAGWKPPEGVDPPWKGMADPHLFAEPGDV